MLMEGGGSKESSDVNMFQTVAMSIEDERFQDLEGGGESSKNLIDQNEMMVSSEIIRKERRMSKRNGGMSIDK